MTQTSIPYLFLRGGTSRGPYFNAADLPSDQDTLAQVLIAAIGAGHPLNINGIGGGAAVTTKVAILSPSQTAGADIDYFFAQVAVEEPRVDFKPTCGNILSGVGPAAIEMGLMAPTGAQTQVRIRAVNTGARISATVQTPDGAVSYDGPAQIDGVPGTAAPIQLAFMDVAGSVTGAMLPTGTARDTIDGIEVTCIDVAMPLVIARAADFGLTGYESSAELDENTDFFARMEAVRQEAGQRMGMGDVTTSVTPKFAILAPARDGGALTARYFMPWKTHPTMAVTGAQCIASCAVLPGSVADGLANVPTGTPATITIEHPLGGIDVELDYQLDGTTLSVISAGLLRTARKLAAGEVFIPRAVWSAR